MEHTLQTLYESLRSRSVKVDQRDNSFELVEFIHELTIEDKKKFLSMIKYHILHMIYIYSYEKKYMEICQVIQRILEERDEYK